MLVYLLDCALYTSSRFSWSSHLERSTKKKSSKSKRYSARDDIGHNPNSTKFQLANCLIRKRFWTDFFHVIQRILQQAAPGQKVSSWSRTWWGSYCGQPEWSSFGGGLHGVQGFACNFSNFFLWFFILFYFLFFAVNTMSLLGIQTTICVSLNSK